MGKIYARKIHAGKITLEDVPPIWKEATKKAYKQLYNEDLEG